MFTHIYSTVFTFEEYVTLRHQPVHTGSFDWFLSGLEWIFNLEFCLGVIQQLRRQEEGEV